MRKHFHVFRFSTDFRKEIPLIAIILAIYINYSTAQSLSFHKLPANTHLSKVPWKDSIYMYPDFLTGKLTFATGFTPIDTFRFNYNLYFGSVDFISNDGDTLQVKPSPELKIIDIGGHLFINHSGKAYVEVILNAPVSLGVLTIFREGSEIADIRGMPSVYDRYYRLAKSYFFINQQNQIHKAIKKSIFKLFPDQKDKIKEYVERNRTDFTKETDLTSLLSFCNQL